MIFETVPCKIRFSTCDREKKVSMKDFMGTQTVIPKIKVAISLCVDWLLRGQGSTHEVKR